ncbi:sigma-70 family RNA polymerase sigma factor [Paenibacillus tarimensis]
MMDQTYREYRPLLFGLAYRMLGTAADAEDIVHDVFAQYVQMDTEAIKNERAYLAQMTANRCINLLKSSRRKREKYTGPWLPEPLPDYDSERLSDPAERRENIGYAYLVLMQRLTPLERAVYILKEALGFQYFEIAEMLDKTETGCRKTFSRAKKKAGDNSIACQPAGGHSDIQEQFAQAFQRASDTGNFKPLLAFLTEEVTLVSDGGGKVRAALRPILGAERVRAFLEGLAAKGIFKKGFKAVSINGDPGLLQERDGRTALALCMEREPDGSRIRSLFLILNPDKLVRFNESPGTFLLPHPAGSIR